MPRRRALVLALALACAAAACGRGDDVERVRRKVEDEAGRLSKRVAAQSDETRDAIEKKMAELDRRIEQARLTTRRVHHARQDAERRLKELEREGRALRRRVEEARRAGTRTWDEIEKSIDRALEDIEGAFTDGGASPPGKS